MMRIISFLLSLVTAGIAIWQLIAGRYYWLVVVLIVLFVALLFFTVFPFLRWGCRMIKLLWRAWRHPGEFLYITNMNVNLLPSKIEPGKGFEWICGFQVISTLLWTKVVSFELEITSPENIKGTGGSIPNVRVDSLKLTDVGNHCFPLTEEVHTHVTNRQAYPRRMGVYNNFFPIRIIVEGNDSEGKPLIHQVIECLVKL